MASSKVLAMLSVLVIVSHVVSSSLPPSNDMKAFEEITERLKDCVFDAMGRGITQEDSAIACIDSMNGFASA